MLLPVCSISSPLSEISCVLLNSAGPDRDEREPEVSCGEYTVHNDYGKPIAVSVDIFTAGPA